MKHEMTRASNWTALREAMAIEWAKHHIDCVPNMALPLYGRFVMKLGAEFHDSQTPKNPPAREVQQAYHVTFTGSRSVNSKGELVCGTYHIKDLRIEEGYATA